MSVDSGHRFINSKSIRLDGKNAFGLNARIECHLSSCPNVNSHVKIHIGSNTSFGDNCHIGAINSVCIGSHVLVGSNVLIIDHNHGSPREDLFNKTTLPFRERDLSCRKVFIDDCVWICDGAKILPGAHIGKGSIVSANALVKGSFPDYSLIR